MSKTVSKTVTDNSLRKWEKKLRNAKTQEQVEKAESMLRFLRPKDKVVKVPKPTLTDEQLMDQAIKENKKKEKFYEEKENEEKKKSLERLQRRAEILKKKSEKEEELSKQKEEQKVLYEQLLKNKEERDERVESHKEFVEQISKENYIVQRLIVKHKGNKKKVQREYKRWFKAVCENVEGSIEFIQEAKELSYEEAKKEVYDHSKKEEVSEEEVVAGESVEVVDEESVARDSVVEELTEEEWQKIVEEHPELKL
jgi:hypothetical protein